MSIALDGFEVLRQMGKHREVFAAARADVDRQARAFIVKCLKAKSTDISALLEICEALGEEQIGLVLESLKDADVKSIVTRLDKHHPDLKGGSAAWRRQHLNALADGSSDPSAPPIKAKKAASKTTKSEPARLKSEVMDNYRTSGKKGR
jgi:hypothetical protein